MNGHSIKFGKRAEAKAEYLEEEYWQQMEGLLVKLARSTVRFNAEFKPAPSSLDSADESRESQSTLNP